MNSPVSSSKEEEAVRRVRALRDARLFEEAEAFGKEAVREYPAHAGLLSEHAATAIRRKTWGAAISRLSAILGLLPPGEERDAEALRLASVYTGLGQPGEAADMVERELLGNPGSLELEKARAELGLLDPLLRDDAAKWERLAALVEQAGAAHPRRVPLIAMCVAGLRFARHWDEARALLDKHHVRNDPAWKEALPDGYARLVIFDNGRTRVEYLQKLFDPETGRIAEADHLAITFDLMEQTWEKEPFAYRPLNRRSADFLSVRKRGKDDFHQDFRREDFLHLARPLAWRYPEVVAVGQSLGGYGGLYYASWLPGCRVLATAPRNPLHPKYGGKRYANHKLFIHEYEVPVNPVARVTIVYDPKNEEDARYVESSLIPRFPSATVLRYPYCGHSVTRYLRDTGALKSATLGFFDGLPFPAFDKSARGKSAEYFRNISRLNLRRGRVARARKLAEKALELGGDIVRTRELLEKIEAAAAVGAASIQTPDD